MRMLIVILVGFISGLGFEWFATYIVYRNSTLPLGKPGLLLRAALVLLSLLLLGFFFDFLLGTVLNDPPMRNDFGRATLLAFSAGVAFRILVRRFKH